MSTLSIFLLMGFPTLSPHLWKNTAHQKKQISPSFSVNSFYIPITGPSDSQFSHLFTVFCVKKHCKSRNVLASEFEDQKVTAKAFSLTLTDLITCKAIQFFQNKITRVENNKMNVCTSCGLFICFKSLRLLHRMNNLFQKSIHLDVLIKSNLDCCV